MLSVNICLFALEGASSPLILFACPILPVPDVYPFFRTET